MLYRKYRPKNFDEVLGQDQVVSMLKGAIKAGRVSHAYLFSGPRGTGKTSVARILAKDIGCHEYDLMEIDAASSRGIDEIRTLREGVYTMPLKGKVKVYIIDEVHMLTKEAFNAFLKTLEEPPAHVVFILATTEPQKLPDTVISRCQHYNFRKVPENILRQSILDIAKKEGYKMDEDGAGLIALFADGSFRDSQSLLDQVLNIAQFSDKKSPGGERISAEEIRRFLSAPPKKVVEGFIDSILNKNTDLSVETVESVSEKGIDIQLFLKFVLRDIRTLMLLKLAPAKREFLEKLLGKEEVDSLWQKKEKASVQELGFILLSILNAYDATGRAYLPQLPLELALAKIHLRNQEVKK